VAAIKVFEPGSLPAIARRLWPALPLCALGIAGLLRDAWPGAQFPAALNLHAIFGAMLWLTVVAQFGAASIAAPQRGAAAVREICRRLSRQVYLLLYILFGVSQLVRLAAILWNSGAPGAAHLATLSPPENLRDYLAYGSFVLLTLHGLAAAQSHGFLTLAGHQHDK
jgi:cytochrome b561